MVPSLPDISQAWIRLVSVAPCSPVVGSCVRKSCRYLSLLQKMGHESSMLVGDQSVGLADANTGWPLIRDVPASDHSPLTVQMRKAGELLKHKTFRAVHPGRVCQRNRIYYGNVRALPRIDRLAHIGRHGAWAVLCPATTPPEES